MPFTLKGKFKIPLQLKLIAGFAMIIAITGMVSIVSYTSLKNSIQRLNTLITSTISANDIIKPAEALPSLLTNYFVDKQKNDKKVILANLSLIKRQIHLLDTQVKSEEGRTELDTLDNLSQTYAQDIEEAIDFIEHRELGEELTGRSAEIRKILGYIKDSAHKLITIELNDYTKIKAREDLKIRMTGVFILIIIILVAVLGITTAVLFSQRTAGIISKLANLSRNIADGNLKIKAVKVGSNDEIGILAQSFNKMGENLQALIGKIIESSARVASFAENLKISAEQNTRASEQIAATMQQVSNGAAEQSAESQKTVQVISKLLEINHKISRSALRVLTIAGNATGAAVEGNEKVNGLITQINIIEREITAIRSISDTLKSRSEEIGEILQQITRISEQTNLLSLNASIEAARAGEHGKGFAVVSQEIRKLADGSTQAVNNIARLLHEIEEESLQMSERMVSGVEQVRIGTQIAGEAGSAFEKIVNTSKDTDSGVQEITDEIRGMVSELKEVEKMTGSIATIAEQSSAGSQEVAASVEEQTASLEEILHSASLLAEMAEELQSMVQRFKL